MSVQLSITRVGPLATIQDTGRNGHLKSGVSASGPMDRAAFDLSGSLLKQVETAAIEFTMAGLAFTISGEPVNAAFAGGEFNLSINGDKRNWNRKANLQPGDEVEITPGASGNYGYVRFSHQIDVPQVLGSRSTNLTAGLGGLNGKPLAPGDQLTLSPHIEKDSDTVRSPVERGETQPIRITWGVHAHRFSTECREGLIRQPFTISTQIDRMGARLVDQAEVFKGTRILSLVSDAVVPGDIQILGDGTPIVLLRDHQPTGGYPRIATVISADLDRFVQIRPHRQVTFEPVTVQHAHRADRARS